MNDYEQERKLILDITTPAWSIERAIGHLLIPTKPGLYLPAKREPVISENAIYLQHDLESDGLVRYDGHDLVFDRTLIKGDVYSEKCELVLKHTAVPMLSGVPTTPERGLDIILDLINNHLVQHFAFNSKDIDRAEHALSDRVLEEYRGTDLVTDLANYVHDIHSPYRSLISDFMGTDHYRQHFVRMIGESAIIIKKQDYRILRFHELLKDGEINVPEKTWDHTC